MKIVVTGWNGFVGQHVKRAVEERGHFVTSDIYCNPDAVIHLGWHSGEFTDPAQYENIQAQATFLRLAKELGVKNLTITGTCLETVPVVTPYAAAKLAVRALARELFHDLKWVRLWYLYGEGQPEKCLLPRLRAAVARGDKTFSVIDGERDFISVEETAENLVRIAEQTHVTGIMDCCTGKAMPVSTFCQAIRLPSLSVIHTRITTDYPMPPYEPKSFHGNPKKMNAAIHDT